MQVVKISDKDGVPIGGTDAALDVNIKSGSVAVSTEGLATSAKQDSLAALVGEVQASPTANTLLDRLKTIASSVTAPSYKGKDRTTTTGAAEELTIPANSKTAIISCGPSSQAYVELNGDATTSSPLYLEDPFGPLILDLGSVTKLSAYVVTGNLGAVFFG